MAMGGVKQAGDWETPRMRLLLIGGPGSGKGTQGARLAERLGIEHVASGDALRAEVARGTDVGRRAADHLERGELVPDEVVGELLTPVVAAAAVAGGYILDGFPRNLAQAHVADEALERNGVGLDAVVHLEVPNDELRRRLLARAEIEGRSDDTPDVIDHRLEVFAHDTFPLVDHYRDRGMLITVSGDRPPDDVTADVLTRLASRPPRATQ
jgi:adenylate kinase